MDKWAIVKLNELIAKVKQAYDNYDIPPGISFNQKLLRN